MTTIVTTRVCSERDVRFSRVYYVFSPRTNRVQFGNFTSNVFPNVGRTSVLISRDFFFLQFYIRHYDNGLPARIAVSTSRVVHDELATKRLI